MPNTAISEIVKLFNSTLELGYFPLLWKKSIIKMIPKPGKNISLPSSYRPISLLPCLSKLFERLFQSKLYPYILEHQIIPNHQFGFQAKHGTIEQVNRLTQEIRKVFERKHYCSAVFLDVAQAFDRVWHEGLILKIKSLLPHKTHDILISYLANRTFQVKYNKAISSEFEIGAGVPQGSVLGPLLYVLYTADIPTSNKVLISTFADDTALLSSNACAKTASKQLQTHLNLVQDWLHTWKIKVNELKSKHITFTLRNNTCEEVRINNIPVPQANEVTYLGIHLDRRLTWKNHIQSRRTQAKLKMASLAYLLNHRSSLSLDNKVLIYKSIIKPILIYGIQLWGSACISSILTMQRTQSSILRSITGAPWFVRNSIIHKDLNIPFIEEEIMRYSQIYKRKLSEHPNPLAKQLLSTGNTSRLKRMI